jgi:hypothetical protein
MRMVTIRTITIHRAPFGNVVTIYCVDKDGKDTNYTVIVRDNKQKSRKDNTNELSGRLWDDLYSEE